MCGNCQKRNNPCSYAPFPKRRGPGKAPKGHRKGSSSKAASGSGQETTPVSTDQPLRPRASTETLPLYTQYPSGSETHLPLPPPLYAPAQPQPPLNEPAPGYPQHYQYPIPMAPLTSRTASQSVSRPFSSLQAQYPPQTEEPSAARAQGLYGRAPPFDSPPGLPQHLQYPQGTPLDARRVRGPSSRMQEPWAGSSEASMAPHVPARHDRHEESSSNELYEFFHEERAPPPPPQPPPGPYR